MNFEKEKIEEVKKVDTGDTLSPSEITTEVDEKESESPEDVSLNSNAEPTAEQAKEAFEEEEPVHEEHDHGHDEDGHPDCEHECCEETHGGSLISEPVAEPIVTEEQEAVEKMLSQSQVNELIGQTRVDTRDKTLKSTWERYGVSDEAGLDALVGNAQKYEMLHDDYKKTTEQLKEANIKLAMYDSGIAPERYEDARLILQGKGLDVTAENIISELKTHPEWKKNFTPNVQIQEDVDRVFKKIDTNPSSVIERLGNEQPEAQSGSSERDIAMSLFRN